jgi:arylsulfatase A-like enzyme
LNGIVAAIIFGCVDVCLTFWRNPGLDSIPFLSSALAIYCVVGFLLGCLMGAAIRTIGWTILRARTSPLGYKIALATGPILSVFLTGLMILNFHGLVTYSHDVFTARVLAANLIYGLLFVVAGAALHSVFRRFPAETFLRGGGPSGKVALVVALLACSVFGGLYFAKEGCPVSGLPRDPGERPNVLWIVMDTVRADALSCYGNKRGATPALDQLAREGVLFENVFATAPWTLPSHASMFTGTFSSKHGLTGNIAVLHEEERITLRDIRETLIAEVFQEAGYITVGFSENPWISRGSGLDRGFGDFFDLWKQEMDRTKQTERFTFLDRAILRAQSFGIIMRRGLKDLTDANYTGTFVKRWLKRADPQKPFFMFINFLEAHHGYTPPEPFRGRHLEGRVVSREAEEASGDPMKYIGRIVELSEEGMQVLGALYRGEISYLDSEIGELLEFLRRGKILDQTVIVVTSDHGENFGWQHLMSHVFVVNDELLRVPLLIRYPGQIPAGRKVQDFIQLVDIFPTLLELADLTFEQEEQIQGLSLIPLIKKGKSMNFERRTVFAETETMVDLLKSAKDQYPSFNWDIYARPLRTVRKENLKYVWAGDGNHALYDFSVDGREMENLISSREDEATELAAVLEDWLASFEHPSPPAQKELKTIDPEMREKLRALGYLR